MGLLDQMARQNAALVEQSANAAAQRLKVQADRLTDAVGVFRVR